MSPEKTWYYTTDTDNSRRSIADLLGHLGISYAFFSTCSDLSCLVAGKSDSSTKHVALVGLTDHNPESAILPEEITSLRDLALTCSWSFVLAEIKTQLGQVTLDDNIEARKICRSIQSTISPTATSICIKAQYLTSPSGKTNIAS